MENVKVMESRGLPMNQRVGLKEQLAYGVGDAGSNFVWTTISMFLILYYTDYVGISAGVVGTIMLITRLLDGITDLGMGAIIDRTNTRWGKARPWILWSAFPMGVGLIFLFNVPNGLSDDGKVAYAYITYIIVAAVIYTASNLAYNTLLSLGAPEPEDRVSMSSIRFFFTLGAVILISNTTIPLVNKIGWSGTSIIFGALAVVLLMTTFLFTKERVEPVQPKKKEPIKNSFKHLLKNKYFILVTLIFVINYMALNIANGITVYYAREILGNAGLVGALVTAFILPKMLGNILYPAVTKRFGKWKSLMGGYLLEIIGLVLIMLMPTNFIMVIVGLIIKGIGGVPHTAGLFALVADVVDYGEWKTGERIDGLVYSATSFGMKVGTGLAGAMIGWVLAFGGYDATLTTQDAGTITAIKALYIYIPLGLYVIGNIILLFTNLDKIYPIIKRDLEERKNNPTINI